MRIAIVGNSAVSMLNFRGSLIQRMIERGFSVLALAPDYNDEQRLFLLEAGATPIDYKLSRDGTNPLSELLVILELKRLFAQHNPDVVLSYFIKPAIYGSIGAYLASVGVRVIMLEGLGYGFADSSSQRLRQKFVSKVILRLLRWACGLADRVLVLNDDDRRAIVERLSIDKDRVINMGGIGVDLDDFEPSPVRSAPKVVGMAARLIAEKGVFEFATVARTVRATDSSIRFILLGDVDDNPGSLSREQIQGWVDEGIIEWPGRVSNIRDWLKEIDVFMLPSYYREGVPRSIQEAMALGLPIITTDHVGCRDTVDVGVNGFLVPIRDVEALVGALNKLLYSPGLAQTMGAASRAIACERFDANKADALIIDLIAEI